MIRKVNQYKNDHFLSQEQDQSSNQEGIDPQRVRRINQHDDVIGQQKDEKGTKIVVKMFNFRQQARKQQRQFHQQCRQSIRLCTVLSSSAFDDNKFKNLNDDKKQGNYITRYNKNSNASQEGPIVSLNLNTEFSQSHLKEKFQIRQTYLRTPYKRESIQFNPNQFLKPQNEFFIFQHENQSTAQISNLLQQNEEDIMPFQLKQTLKKLTYYLTFFDYVYAINKPRVQGPDTEPFPKAVQMIARVAADSHQPLSDSEEPYDARDIDIPEAVTEHRIVICNQDDLTFAPQSMYFPTVASYMQYKKLRQMQYKRMKIQDKDIQINTDVRNIISSEKIYLIQIMKEVDLFKKLAKQAQTYNVIKSIHSHLYDKIDEYLRLICGYSESTITNMFNIEDQNEKIYDFIFKSIKYGKEIRKKDPQIIEMFPVMDIWYSIPKHLFGYEREVLHQTLYELIELLQGLEHQIKLHQQYEKMKEKKSHMKYYADYKL